MILGTGDQHSDPVFFEYNLGSPYLLLFVEGYMSDDFLLFSGDEQTVSAAQQVESHPIPEWQVGLLRKALDARGLTCMEDRQRTIESAAGRKVESLRSLTHNEGVQVLSRLGQLTQTAHTESSSWDDREEQTWIDRL